MASAKRVESQPVRRMRPYPSLESTQYGRRSLAALGQCHHCPYAASRHLPPRAVQLER
jgi:hypothetical protein